MLKYISSFKWTLKCQQVFKKLKLHLSLLKIFSYPRKGDDPSHYLEVADLAISALLIQDKEGNWKLVYYASRYFMML